MAMQSTTQAQTNKTSSFVRCGTNLLKLSALTRCQVLPTQGDDSTYYLSLWQRNNPQQPVTVMTFDTEEEALKEMTQLCKQVQRQTKSNLLVLANGFIDIEWVDRVVSIDKPDALLIGLFNESPQVQPHWLAFKTEEERSACLDTITSQLL
ncbi:hypothetical protein [Aeromonas media]|uniref:hypothetical protein n=1 Tax=Aeromonas media TaxID=651 RepID=UPI001A1D34D5|nr:hypothetical protein [Aeromonas hydrophila]HAT2511644.1 hypothetical protein [Aeromonas hydrophila]HAT2533268.1 hypothetical protein [Aeromonas hydrophila]